MSIREEGKGKGKAKISDNINIEKHILFPFLLNIRQSFSLKNCSMYVGVSLE